MNTQLRRVLVEFFVENSIDDHMSSPRKGSLWTYLLKSIGNFRDFEFISLSKVSSVYLPSSYIQSVFFQSESILSKLSYAGFLDLTDVRLVLSLHFQYRGGWLVWLSGLFYGLFSSQISRLSNFCG